MHFNRKINKKTQYSIHHGIKYVEDKNDLANHKTTVDTATVELRRDISKRVDIGIHGGYLHDWKEGTLETVAGISIGVTPVKNAWAELGYNFEGFDDDDFDKSNFKRKGPYVDFRYKFNQDTLKGDLPIRRKTAVKYANLTKKKKPISKSNKNKPVIKKESPKLETLGQQFEQYISKDTTDNLAAFVIEK